MATRKDRNDRGFSWECVTSVIIQRVESVFSQSCTNSPSLKSERDVRDYPAASRRHTSYNILIVTITQILSSYNQCCKAGSRSVSTLSIGSP